MDQLSSWTFLIDVSRPNGVIQDGVDKINNLKRHLKARGWSIYLNENLLNEDNLSTLKVSTTVIALLDSKVHYNDAEITALKKYMSRGGKLLVTSADSQSSNSGVILSKLTKFFGVRIFADSVIRTNKYKYSHPKEVHLVKDAITNRGLMVEMANINENVSSRERPTRVELDVQESNKWSFVYPFGATLDVVPPAITLLTSSIVSLPVNRPICALYLDQNKTGGAIVIGSTKWLCDDYIDREQNLLYLEVFLRFFNDPKTFKFDEYDAKNFEPPEYKQFPDLKYLANLPLTSFQSSEPLPEDIKSLFEKKLFRFDNSLLPLVLGSYSMLDGLQHEPLSLIKPKFETPMAQLQPAVFGPVLKYPKPPRLELFDLDIEFMPVLSRLRIEAGKCHDGDDSSIERFIKTSGAVLRVPGQETKQILDLILRTVVSCKKIHP